ncbi:MAG: hypothetical protein KAJ90_07100, partial [Desulfobacterales bacterium]|nr:hypothetical protein [Desulfobacterales bacterium]
ISSPFPRTHVKLEETMPNTKESGKNAESTKGKCAEFSSFIGDLWRNSSCLIDGKGPLLLYGVSAFVLLFVFILGASFSNANVFSFKQQGDVVEVRQGHFGPIGMGLVGRFTDIHLPTDDTGNTIANNTCTRKQAYDVLFQYYLSQADQALNVQDTPNLQQVETLLRKAESYALTDDDQQDIIVRNNGIRFLAGIGKVNLALVKNTKEDLKAARGCLSQMKKFAITPAVQQQLIKEQLAAVESAR